MKTDDLKLLNLKRLCRENGIETRVALAEALGFKGASARSFGSQLWSGKRKITGKTLKSLCELFHVEESEFLIDPRKKESVQESNQRADITTIMRMLVESQGETIKTIQKRVEAQADAMKRLKEALATKQASLDNLSNMLSMHIRDTGKEFGWIKQKMVEAATKNNVRLLKLVKCDK